MRHIRPEFIKTNLLLSCLLLVCLSSVIPNALSTSRGTGGSALLVIDVQGCFLPGGALPVDLNDLQSLITNINTLRTAGRFDAVIFTQDYHPANHVSFAAVHDKQPVDVMQLQYTADASICGFNHLYPEASLACDNNSSSRARSSTGSSNHSKPEVLHNVQQVLWPEHCMQHTAEVSLHPGLMISPQDMIVRKGWLPHLDAYSAFKDNGKFRSTGLAGLLRQRGIKRVTVVGVALDYCVLWSALDANDEGFDTTVVLDATAPVSSRGGANAVQRLRDAGVRVEGSIWDIWKI